MASSITDEYKSIEAKDVGYTYKLKCVICHKVCAFIGATQAWLVGPVICPECHEKKLAESPKALSENADK